MVRINLFCILFTIGLSHTLKAQQKTTVRTFQFSIVPGVGKNGLHPGGFKNIISFNLTSGYSNATLLFEVAGISNLNTDETRGLQFAGLANITGGNSFAGLGKKELEKKVNSVFEANLTGIQVSGITNIVITNVFGAQLTGISNISGGALMGLQISGVSNVVRKYSFGMQLAGLWNSSVQSMDGLQVAGLMNYTGGQLHGVQVSLINKAERMEGKNSVGGSRETALQLGIFNMASKMNGFQIGLINVAKRSQGTQVGLINIYRSGKDGGTKDGTAIGLVNIGGLGHVAVYADELFYTTYEVATGNCKNRRIQNASANRYVMNSLLFSNNSNGFIRGRESWALGYGLKYYLYNRPGSSGGIGEYRYLAIGIETLHINRDAKSITKDLSLLMRPKIQVGTRLHPKIQSIYLFAAVTYNLYITNSNVAISPDFLERTSNVNGRLLE